MHKAADASSKVARNTPSLTVGLLPRDLAQSILMV